MPILIGKLKPLYKSFDSQKKPKYTINKNGVRYSPQKKNAPENGLKTKMYLKYYKKYYKMNLNWIGLEFDNSLVNPTFEEITISEV